MDKTSAIAEEPMMQFFGYTHLPENLRAVSEPFCRMAEDVCCNLPRNPERTVCLRKLMEAKDCAVRARIYKSPEATKTVRPAWAQPGT